MFANKQASYKLASVDTTVMVAGQAGCSFILELELKGSDGDAFPVYLIGRHLCWLVGLYRQAFLFSSPHFHSAAATPLFIRIIYLFQ